MSLFATVVALVNLGAAVVTLPSWARAAAIAANAVFVLGGLAAGDPLVWVAHLALIPLNTALLVGGLDGRSV